MVETLYCARAFSSPQRPLNFCTEPYPSREAAIAELRRKRPEAVSCMTSEARVNANTGEIVPTHDGVEWHDFPAGPDRWLIRFWHWLLPKP